MRGGDVACTFVLVSENEGGGDDVGEATDRISTKACRRRLWDGGGIGGSALEHLRKIGECCAEKVAAKA